MCFKPQSLDRYNTVVSGGAAEGKSVITDTSSGGTLKKVSIRLDRPTHANHKSIHNTFLKFIDLTGCYLVPEEGLNPDGSSVSVGQIETRYSMNNVVPDKLIHVISHEIDSSDDDTHHLICSEALSTTRAYTEYCIPMRLVFMILCLMKLSLIHFLQRILKNQIKDKYIMILKNSYFHKEGQILTNHEFADEAILSMFVIVDTDKQSTENNLVLSSTTNFFETNLPDGEYTMNFSDGEESKKITFTTTTNNAYNL